ncbi:CROCC protein, partial [Amia calva]|nr:CROCC protein [Amia calva]
TPERSPGSRPPSPERSDAPPPNLDPELVRSGLRDFVQELRETQRERDEVRAQLCAVSRRVGELEGERDAAQHKLSQLEKTLSHSQEGRRDVDSRLSCALAALQQQEEAVRRGERERSAL